MHRIRIGSHSLMFGLGPRLFRFHSSPTQRAYCHLSGCVAVGPLTVAVIAHHGR